MKRAWKVLSGGVLAFATLCIWMYYRVPANFEQARERMAR